MALLNELFEVERRVFNPLRSTLDGRDDALSMFSQLCLVTSNERKRRTYEAFLDAEITVIPLSINEIQDIDPRVVAIDKAVKAYEVLKRPVLVEQSAMAMRAWGGLPGAMTSAFLRTVGVRGLCQMMETFDDRYAEAIAAVAFTDGSIKRSFIGSMRGEIARQCRGTGSGGWDPIFVPEGFQRTLAEMDEAERMSISMRRRAAGDLMRFLSTRFSSV